MSIQFQDRLHFLYLLFIISIEKMFARTCFFHEISWFVCKEGFWCLNLITDFFLGKLKITAANFIIKIKFLFCRAYIMYHLLLKIVCACERVWVQRPGCPQATGVGGDQEASASEAFCQATPLVYIIQITKPEHKQVNMSSEKG